MRLANDSSQTKSIRRTHKQNYEAAQQKLLSIDQNLSLVKTRQLHQQSPKKMTQDDINLHKNANRLLKNSLLAQTGNTQTLNCNSSLMYMERRNSMKSTCSSLGSSNTFIVQSPPNPADSYTSPKMMQQQLRTRHDSFSNNSHFEYESQHSPTPSHYSIQSSQHQQQQLYLQQQQQQQMQHQQMLRYQKSLKIKADQNYSPNHHYHNHPQIYPNPNESPQHYANRMHAMNMQQQIPQQIHYAQDLLLTTAHSPHNNSYRSELVQTHSMRQTNYSDELKENNHQMLMQQQIRYHRVNNVEPLRPPQQPQRQVQQGLGGYWVLNENNEKIWCQTNDEKFSSLDRKSQIQKLKSTSSPNITVCFWKMFEIR